MDTFIQQILNGLVLGSMYALIALGYTMVYGVLNLINFAHGDVLMIGAMIGLSILKLLGVYAPGLPGYVQLAIAILGAIPACIDAVSACIAGKNGVLLMDRAVLPPSRRASMPSSHASRLNSIVC